MSAATITLTGRPCHRATIATDADTRCPCDGVCVCGDRWHHQDDPAAVIVMDWYWQHVQPAPDPRAVA